ncbi:MAG TPA: YopT-type cysteine protease domain-containing protein [Dongiaceae bacterium]|nr:YopT-type cysteine protease domain-containing protein [Dongiaceae bacterium]
MSDHELLAKAMYLYKIQMDNYARANGGTVIYLNQHTVLWGVQQQKSHDMGDHSYAGVCAGLAIEWIRGSLKGDDFISKLNTARSEVFTQGKSKGFGKDAGALFTGVDKAHYEQKDVKAAFKSVATCSKDTSATYPFGGANKNFTKGNYYYISTATHATAAYCHGDTVDFYDPNVGVAKGVKKKMIEGYFKSCIDETLKLVGASASDAKGKKLGILGFKSL